MKNLMSVLEQGGAPDVPSELPAWFLNPNDKTAVDAAVQDLFSTYYYKALDELGSDARGQAAKSAKVRAKVSAEAIIRVLKALDDTGEMLQRAAARTVYLSAVSGLWTADASEPNSIEEWIMLRLSEEGISKTYKSYLGFLLGSLIPVLRQSGGEDEITKLFALKDHWRRAMASIPIMRNAVEIADATQKVYTKDLTQKERLLNELNDALAIETDQEEQKKLREQISDQKEAVREAKAEMNIHVGRTQKDVLATVNASVDVIQNSSVVSQGDIQDAIQEEVAKRTKSPIPVVKRKKFSGALMQVKAASVFFLAVPAQFGDSIQMLTGDSVEWRTIDADKLITDMLALLPKMSYRLCKKFIKEYEAKELDK